LIGAADFALVSAVDSVPAIGNPVHIRSSPTLFRGWLVVAGVFITLLVTSGLGFYNASVILQAATEEFDASVSAVSGATTMFFAVGGVSSFALARLMDRADLRWFYVAGGVAGAAALTGLRWVNSVAGLYVFFALFGVGFALAGLVPGTSVVARWFTVRRSVALSIATTGLSVGGIAITPIAARLIRDRSLSEAGPILGAVWLLGVIPVALVLIRSHPSDLGLQPDGAALDETEKATRSTDGATFRQAVGTRFFRFLAAAYALIFMAQVGAIAQLFTLATERVDRTTAAASLSALAFASVVGRLAGGLIATKVSTRLLTGVLCVVQTVALVLIALAGTRGALIFGCVVFGISIGNLLMLQPLLLAEAFGVREYARIYSFGQLLATVGVAGGPFLIGFLRDIWSYQTAFLLATVGNVLAIGLLALAGSAEEARLETASRKALYQPQDQPSRPSL